jgi:hypothetical protein
VSRYGSSTKPERPTALTTAAVFLPAGETRVVIAPHPRFTRSMISTDQSGRAACPARGNAVRDRRQPAYASSQGG